jgi:hypothetical protein
MEDDMKQLSRHVNQRARSFRRNAAALCLLLAGAGAAVACGETLGIPEAQPREEGAGGAPDGCTTHAECRARGPDYDLQVCVEGGCVNLLDDISCPLVLPQVDDLWYEGLTGSGPEPLILGALLPMTNSIISSYSSNYDLVLAEVTRMAGGIPSTEGPRPVIVVGCNSTAETTEMFDRSIDHLIDVLKVPAILVSTTPGRIGYAFERSAKDHVFFLSAVDADPSLLELDAGGMLWHMLPGQQALAPTYVPLLARAIDHLRFIGTLGMTESVRVSLVQTTDEVGLSTLATALKPMLRFNGKSAEENGAEYFQEVPILSSVGTSTPPDYGPAIRALKDFSPHIIIAIAGDEFPQLIMTSLEGDPPSPRPFYLLSPYHTYSGALGERVRGMDVHQRVVGVNWAAAEDPTAYLAYLDRFYANYPTYRGRSGLENFYDAAYYLLYAAAAVQDRWPLIGPDFPQGMRRLLSGSDIFRVGPDDVVAGFAALGDPEVTIRLDGTMGPPDFDPSTGARSTPGTVWCKDIGGFTHADMLRLNSENELVGSFPCFGFNEP